MCLLVREIIELSSIKDKQHYGSQGACYESTFITFSDDLPNKKQKLKKKMEETEENMINEMKIKEI